MLNDLFCEVHLHLSARWHMARRARAERGAAMVEYSLLVGLLALVAFAAIQLFGESVGQDFSDISSEVVRAT